MVSILLAKKIAELFLYLLAGAVVVRCGLLKKEDNIPISKISLYLMTPCIILNSFQVELTDTIRTGFIAAFVVAIVIQLVFILVTNLWGKMTHATDVEMGSIIYSNTGNLIIPVVASVLGDEMVIYATAYTTVFNILVWTHGKSIFDKNNGPVLATVKKICLNVNIIAIATGAIMLFTGLRFPSLIATAVSTTGSMLGPASMFVTGMVLGSMKLENLLSRRRIWMVALMRMIICPLIAIAIIKGFHLGDLIPGGHMIFLVTLLAAAAPQAATINQFAILYHKDSEYASSINILTTLACIGTMPLMVWLYELIG